MDDSERDFPNAFSSTLMVSLELTVIVLAMARSRKDRTCTIGVRRGDMYIVERHFHPYPRQDVRYQERSVPSIQTILNSEFHRTIV